MNRNDKKTDDLLERGLEAIRSERIETGAAAARAWDRVKAEGRGADGAARQVDRIEGCADFQALIPAFLLGGLTESRALLLQDHVRECVPCRKAMRDARGGTAPSRPAVGRAAFRLSTPARRAVAAALLVGTVVVPLTMMRGFVPVASADVVIEEASGPVLRLRDAEAVGLAKGDTIASGERVRTAREAGAVVRVGDDAVVEMRERSQFRVTRTAAGATLWLDRGSIIVRPASGDGVAFAVSTPDCLVTASKATYAVSSGVKGSRVSAVSGDLTVDVAGDERKIHGGEQVSTTPSLAGVPVRDDVAWSRSAGDLDALLAQISSLRADLNARVSMPDTRYSSRLVGLLPEETAFYAALPNLGGTIAQAQKIVDEHVNSNQALRDWMQGDGAASRAQMRSALDQVREVSGYLGQEVVVGARAGKGDGAPVVMAEVADAAGLRAFVESRAASGVVFVDDPAAAQAARQDALYVWLTPDTLVASPSLDAVRSVAGVAAAPDANPFLTTPFYARLAGLYAEGAGIIVAVDLQRIIGGEASGGDEAAYSSLGLSNFRNLVFTQRGSGDSLQSQAILTFGGERRGITTWLAAPGPMGALEYVSPEASAAAAFVIDKPTALADDLFSFLRKVQPEELERFEQLQAEHGIDVRANFAAPLGGEFAFAVDGPVLPTPSWKMIIEVYDPATLQSAIEHAVGEVNRYAAAEGHPGLALTAAEAGGVTYHTLVAAEGGIGMTYAFTNGYLVAGPNQAIVERAIRTQETGASLPRSAKFRAAIPGGPDANFSAVVYHDLGALVAPYAGQIAKASGADRKALEAMTNGPTMIVARSGADHIAFSGRSGGSALGLTPEMLFAGPGSLGLGEILGGTIHND